jgi:hypothetical protein
MIGHEEAAVAGVTGAQAQTVPVAGGLFPVRAAGFCATKMLPVGLERAQSPSHNLCARCPARCTKNL